MSEFLGRRCGGSTGTNLWAAFVILKEMAAAGEKGSLVTILCDSGDRYRSTLFDDGWLAAQGLSCADHEAELRQLLKPASPTSRVSMHDASYGRVVNQ
jgi:cysteine synthase A